MTSQGVTKEDIQRAEDTLKAAYQGQSKNNPLSTDTSTVPNPPEGGSGDVDCGQNFFVPHAHPASESQGGGMIDSSVATIIEKWQKKDGEVVVKGDLRAPVGSRGSVLGSPALNKKDYSVEITELLCDVNENTLSTFGNVHSSLEDHFEDLEDVSAEQVDVVILITIFHLK